MPKTFLILDNPKPTNGLGSILRCSSAFDITEVIFVGVAKCNTQGAHGANRHLQITSVATWEKAIAYVKDSSNENCIKVIGIDGIRGFQGEMTERGNNNEFSTIIDDFYSKFFKSSRTLNVIRRQVSNFVYNTGSTKFEKRPE